MYWNYGYPYLLVYFHSLSQELDKSVNFLHTLNIDLKCDVLGIEYPGYGLHKDFKPNEFNIKQDAIAVYKFISEELANIYQIKNVIFMGQSLGTGIAVYLASQYEVGGIILISPYLSIRKATRHYLGCCGACA